MNRMGFAMKKVVALLFLCLALAGCMVNQNATIDYPVYQTADNRERGCMELVRDGIVYRPYGHTPKKLRDGQIGVREDVPEAIICAVKGYRPEEWIVEYLDVLMGGGDMLWKAVGVAEIPPELALYKDVAYNFE